MTKIDIKLMIIAQSKFKLLPEIRYNKKFDVYIIENLMTIFVVLHTCKPS